MNTSQPPTSTTDLSLFENIGNFVKDLADCFDTKSILLYNRLLEKTTFQHKESIVKHNECFRTFYKANKEAILTKNVKDISSMIVFSDKIFIDISDTITSASDEQIKSAIWNHLLKISSIIDPDSGAKDILKQGSKNEEQFLSNMFSKIKSETENGDSAAPENPMAAISKMMSSGIFSELVSGMNSGVNNGELDLSKMLGMVGGLLGQMNTGNNAGGGSNAGGVNLEELTKQLTITDKNA